MKKRLHLLSEVALHAVKRRLTSSFAILGAKKLAERESASHNLLLSSTLRYKALYFKMLFSNLAFVLQVFQLIEKGTFRYFQVLKRHSLAPN